MFSSIFSMYIITTGCVTNAALIASGVVKTFSAARQGLPGQAMNRACATILLPLDESRKALVKFGRNVNKEIRDILDEDDVAEVTSSGNGRVTVGIH